MPKTIPILMMLFLVLMTARGASSEVPASEVLAHISNHEPVEYDHVTIKGNLNLNQQQLNLIRITDSRIDGVMNFNGAKFLDIVNFERTKFLRDSDFSGSQFMKDAHFSGSQFMGDADFSESKFSKDADLREAKFSGRADFGNSNFNGTAYFGGSSFSKDADFWSTSFKRYADFRSANFREDSDFWRSNFNDIADFQSTNFKGYADFSESKFNENADFSESKFSGRADFGSSGFKEDANFQSSNFTETANFKDTQFNKALNFRFISFNKLILDWYSIKNRNLFISDKDSFIHLIKHFKDMGDFASADDLYYHYRNWRITSESFFSIKGFTDFVFLISCGYGVKPLHTILLSFVLILLFSSIYKQMKIVQKLGKNASYMDALFFSASIFFTFLPTPPMWGFSERWRFLILVEDILGWILMTLFVVTMGNVIIR